MEGMLTRLVLALPLGNLRALVVGGHDGRGFGDSADPDLRGLWIGTRICGSVSVGLDASLHYVFEVVAKWRRLVHSVRSCTSYCTS